MILKQLSKILFPPFIEKIDRYFLLNRPRLWVLKLHYICYYAILANLLIVFLVFLSPFKTYYLSTFLFPGFVILSIGELILFIYWWYKQSLYNIEKQYGKTLPNKIFLEIIGYSICILLIASGTIVFYVSTAVKIQSTIPRSQVIVDALMLDSILLENKFQENYVSSQPGYLNRLKAYLNSNEFKRKNISINCYEDKKTNRSAKPNAFKSPIPAEEQRGFIAILCKNKELKIYLEKSISTESLKLLIDKNLIFTVPGNVYNYYQEIFDKPLDETTKKYIKDNFGDLVEAIRKGEIKKIDITINQYIGEDIDKTSQTEMFYKLKKAISSSLSIYSIFYRWELFKVILFNNYLALNLCLLLLFFFKSTYLIDFIFAFIYIFSTIAALSVTVSLKLFPFNDDWNIIVFVVLPTLFISYQGLGTRKKKYSRFKTFNLVAFPFAIVVSTFLVIFYFGGKNSNFREFIDSETFVNVENIYLVSIIICLVYLPFIPYLKGELIRQLSLPKD